MKHLAALSLSDHYYTVPGFALFRRRLNHVRAAPHRLLTGAPAAKTIGSRVLTGTLGNALFTAWLVLDIVLSILITKKELKTE